MIINNTSVYNYIWKIKRFGSHTWSDSIDLISLTDLFKIVFTNSAYVKLSGNFDLNVTFFYYMNPERSKDQRLLLNQWEESSRIQEVTSSMKRTVNTVGKEMSGLQHL